MPTFITKIGSLSNNVFEGRTSTGSVPPTPPPPPREKLDLVSMEKKTIVSTITD